MQVSVEKLGDLERRMTVQVPAERIDPEVKNRLTTLCRKVRLDGFRPGKVPFKIIKRMYGTQVRQEVMGEVVQSSYQEALLQEKLHPIGRPKIEPKNFDEGEDLKYSVTFEIFPEFEVKGIDELKIHRPVAEVTEADVDNMIETLRKQRTTWNAVERPAQEGDRVTIDFEGKLNGEDFPKNKDQDVDLVLGSGSMVKEFEENLVGLRKDTETEFAVTFPEDYHIEDVAGKTVQFKVKVKAVTEPLLPEVNEEFAAAFEVKQGGIQGLREAIRHNMEHELAHGVRTIIKEQLLQGLLDANDIPLPQAMVNAQIEELAGQTGLSARTKDDEEAARLKTELFESESRRRVTLGLIISQLASTNDIKIDEARVRSHVASFASGYQDSAAVIQWYDQNPKAQDGVRASVLEEQVVEWLLDRAQVTDKPSSFNEIMHLDQKAGGSSQE